MTNKQRIQAYNALLVEKFNTLYPEGSKVKLRKIASSSCPVIECTVSYKAHLNFYGTPVAFFNEIAGQFRIYPEFVQYPDDKTINND